MRILLLEGGQSFTEIQRGLLSGGVICDIAHSPYNLVASAKKYAYDLILIGQGIGDNIKAIGALRRANISTPIMMLSTASCVTDILNTELIRGVILDTRKQSRGGVQAYDLKLIDQMLYYRDKSVHLSCRENDVMTLLLKRPDEHLSRGHLIDRVYRNIDAPSNMSIQVYIYNIRKKIKTLTDDIQIEVQWGYGYRLTTNTR